MFWSSKVIIFTFEKNISQVVRWVFNKNIYHSSGWATAAAAGSPRGTEPLYPLATEQRDRNTNRDHSREATALCPQVPPRQQQPAAVQPGILTTHAHSFLFGVVLVSCSLPPPRQTESGRVLYSPLSGIEPNEPNWECCSGPQFKNGWARDQPPIVNHPPCK